MRVLIYNFMNINCIMPLKHLKMFSCNRNTDYSQSCFPEDPVTKMKQILRVIISKSKCNVSDWCTIYSSVQFRTSRNLSERKECTAGQTCPRKNR